MTFCPRDKQPLARIDSLRRSPALSCESCSGLWLSGSVVVSIMGHVPRPSSTLTSELSTSLTCPDDGHELVPLFHEGIELDVCTHCGGVWLDNGELERINARAPVPRLAKELASDPLGAMDVADGAFEVIGAIVEFVADALSSL